MNYYRLSKGTEVKYAALPSEFWLPIAEYVSFNSGFKGGKDGCRELFGLVADREDDPDWDFSSLPETQYDACVELTVSEYRLLTGDITHASYYHRNGDEPYYEDFLPTDWEEKAMRILLPDPYWADQFGIEGDWRKLVDGEIDNFNTFYTLIDLMHGTDPVLELEAYDHWIYGHAFDANEMFKEEMDMNKPLDWLANGDWSWVCEYCNSQDEYGTLDLYFRILNGDLDKEDEWCRDMTMEEIKRDYSNRFTLLLAGVLRNLGDAIGSGEIQFRIRYPQ